MMELDNKENAHNRMYPDNEQDMKTISPTSMITELKHQSRNQTGIILKISGQAEKRKQLLLEKEQESKYLTDLLQVKEESVNKLKLEVKQLKESLRGTKGQNSLLEYRLMKTILVNQQLHEGSSQISDAANQSWLIHWKKFQNVLKCIETTDIEIDCKVENDVEHKVDSMKGDSSDKSSHECHDVRLNALEMKLQVQLRLNDRLKFQLRNWVESQMELHLKLAEIEYKDIKSQRQAINREQLALHQDIMNDNCVLKPIDGDDSKIANIASSISDYDANDVLLSYKSNHDDELLMDNQLSSFSLDIETVQAILSPVAMKPEEFELTRMSSLFNDSRIPFSNHKTTPTVLSKLFDGLEMNNHPVTSPKLLFATEVTDEEKLDKANQVVNSLHLMKSSFDSFMTTGGDMDVNKGSNALEVISDTPEVMTTALEVISNVPEEILYTSDNSTLAYQDLDEVMGFDDNRYNSIDNIDNDRINRIVQNKLLVSDYVSKDKSMTPYPLNHFKSQLQVESSSKPLDILATVALQSKKLVKDTDQQSNVYEHDPRLCRTSLGLTPKTAQMMATTLSPDSFNQHIQRIRSNNVDIKVDIHRFKANLSVFSRLFIFILFMNKSLCYL